MQRKYLRWLTRSRNQHSSWKDIEATYPRNHRLSCASTGGLEPFAILESFSLLHIRYVSRLQQLAEPVGNLSRVCCSLLASGTTLSIFIFRFAQSFGFAEVKAERQPESTPVAVGVIDDVYRREVFQAGFEWYEPLQQRKNTFSHAMSRDVTTEDHRDSRSLAR